VPTEPGHALVVVATPLGGSGIISRREVGGRAFDRADGVGLKVPIRPVASVRRRTLAGAAATLR